MQNMRPLPWKIEFVDGTHKTVALESHIVAKDLLQALCQKNNIAYSPAVVRARSALCARR